MPRLGRRLYAGRCQGSEWPGIEAARLNRGPTASRLLLRRLSTRQRSGRIATIVAAVVAIAFFVLSGRLINPNGRA